MEKESIYRYVKLKQCAVRQQSKQHCKPTILQQKKNVKDYRTVCGELKTLQGAGGGNRENTW